MKKWALWTGVTLAIGAVCALGVFADSKPTANEIASKAPSLKVGDDPTPPPLPYKISGPTKARASQMIRLRADGVGATSVQWMPVSDDEFPYFVDDYVSPEGKIERGKLFTFEMPANAAKQTFIILVSGPTPSMAKWSVALDGPAPKPDVDPPGPTPPGPKPPVPTDSLKVLILEETADQIGRAHV